MKFRFLHILAAAALAVSCNSANSAPQDIEFTLSEGWTIHSDAVPGLQYKAVVPSTVLSTLTDNGLYKGALEGTGYHEAIDRDDFACPWWYEKTFRLPALKEGQRVLLDFEGISYSAEIWLNGKLVAGRDQVTGPFRQHRFDITNLIAGENVLSVKVFRCEDGDFNIGFVDWNPRAADESMGIFRPVRVRITDAVAISDLGVRTKVNLETLKEAWVTADLTVTNYSAEPVDGRLVYRLDGKKFSLPVSLAAGEKKAVRVDSESSSIFHMVNPRLWWCHNLGKPEMYGMDVVFLTSDDLVSDSKSVDFGVRQVDTYFTEEGHRGFILNGKKVLIKGAGWTDDIFLRNPDSRNDIELEYVKDMNLNAVRFENIWGTSQNVYDLCDRKGLLALVGWSCFWEWEVYCKAPNDRFGCIKDEDDMDLVAASLKDQILWLRNHPSIIAWYVGSDDLPRPALEERYLKVMDELSEDRIYVASAKGLFSKVTGRTGMKMVGPYDYEAPSYWYENAAPGGSFGFNTETGIGAQMPVRASIEKMIPADQLWPVGSAYDFHCTVAGEDMHDLHVLKEMVASRYGEASDLDDFLRKSHHLDYDGTRAMFEGFRVAGPRATGIIQWMLNSAWPSLYWQLYDWYLAPCASYWSVKKACAPQQLVYNYVDKHVYGVNDEAESFNLTAEIELYDIDGKLVFSESRDAFLAPAASAKLVEIPSVEGVSFLFLTLRKGGKTVETNHYLLSSVDDTYDWSRYNWIHTGPAQCADYKALSTLGKAKVTKSVHFGKSGLELKLTNTSDKVAFFIELALKDQQGELVVPAFWSDNFLSLRPGETRAVTCRLPGGVPENLRVEVSGWNVE